MGRGRQRDLHALLNLEKKHTIGDTSFLHVVKIALTGDPAWKRWRYVHHMRHEQYASGIARLWWCRRKNCLGNLLGFEMSGENIGPGIYLIHNGPIVINAAAVLGKNVKFHGDNCVGNNGKTDDCPVIGDNVDIGVGAKVLGGVYVAEDCVIGAGAVVVKDAVVPGSVLVGVPARAIH